jgi:hypothetical protein
MNNSDIPTRLMRTTGPLSPEERAKKQKRFLTAFRKSGNIKYACQSAGIHRSTYYEWRDHDEAFKAYLPDAVEDAHDTLEFAAYDRAVQGVESHVVSVGKVVYEEVPVLDAEGNQKFDKNNKPITKPGKPITERKYSDPLLITLLKAHIPERYKDKQQVDITTQSSVQDALLTQYMTDEEIDVIESIMNHARIRKTEADEKSHSSPA